MELLPKWKMLDDGDVCYIDTPIGNQTLHMEFGMSDWTMDTIWFNVYMTLYNKKKQLPSDRNVRVGQPLYRYNEEEINFL